MRPKGPKLKKATKVNKTMSEETNYFQNSHSMFIKPTVLLVRSVVEDGISITVYWYKADQLNDRVSESLVKAKRWWWRKEHSFLIRYSESPKQLIVKMPYPDVNNVTGCLYIHFYSLSPVAVPHESKNEIRDFLFPVSIVIWLNEAAERILRS